MAYQLPSTIDMFARINAKPRKKKAKVTMADDPNVPQPGGSDAIAVDAGQQGGSEAAVRGSGKRPRLEESSLAHNKHVIVSFAKSVCSLNNPSSIEEQVGMLLHEEDLDQLQEMGMSKASDYLVQRNYQALQAALFIRNKRESLDNTNWKLNQRNSSLVAQNKKLKEKEFALKGDASRAESEARLAKEQMATEQTARAEAEEATKALRKELDSVATRVMAQAHIELLTEFKEGKSSSWDVKGQIRCLKGFLEADADTDVDAEDEEEEEETTELGPNLTGEQRTPPMEEGADAEVGDGKVEATTTMETMADSERTS